ncbi:MAG: MATE family efflux transporter [Muribaculaceae bacterium]|nr:MATE family efflux transporter [Muribaculaceae bacterium]
MSGALSLKAIDKSILRLAVPAIVSNVTVPLLGLCDTAVSGHLGGSAPLGAIAVGTMMLNVAYWLFGFLRMGTTGLTAEAFGSGDRDTLQSVLLRGLGLGLLIGIALICLRGPLGALILHLAGAEPEVAALARDYYDICICGAPALLGTMALTGWMIGNQSTGLPMTVAIITNIINIAGSLTFVFGIGLGFTGVAYGTLVAQWCGLVLSIIFSCRLGGTYTPLFSRGASKVWRSLVAGGGLGRYFKVNVNLFFRSVCIMSVSMTVTAVGARIGDITLAANAVMMQFFIFFSYFMDGFAFAGEALCGRYKGAGDWMEMRRSIRRILGWSVCMALLFFCVYLLAGMPIARMLTDDEAVRMEIARYSWAFILIPPLSVGAFVFDGFYIGLTDTGRLLAATVTAACIFFVISFLPLHTPLAPNALLWTAFLSYLSIRALVLGAMLPGVVVSR